jgi:uncharacterized integral membrane protein
MRSSSQAPDQATSPTPAQSVSQVDPASATTPAGQGAPAPGMTRKGKVRRTRASAWWIGLIVAAVILVALLIFIAQNSSRIAVHYFSIQGHVSLAIALLLSAVAGVLLVAIPGTARVIQLRHALKKNTSNPR